MSRLPIINLTRLRSLSGDAATVGALTYKDFRGFTIENPWMNNAPFHSCVPDGLYLLRLGRFNAGGYAAYELDTVAGRDLIKMHVANRAADVDGCIGIGDSISYLNGDVAVMNSQDTFTRFMDLMDGAKKAWLSISWR